MPINYWLAFFLAVVACEHIFRKKGKDTFVWTKFREPLRRQEVADLIERMHSNNVV